jgi:NitT/TauT family transport system permease protein
MRSSADQPAYGLLSLMSLPSWETRGLKIPGTRVMPVLGVASLVAIWWMMSLRFDVAVLPSPVIAFEETKRLMVGGELIVHTAASLYRLLAGFIIGCLVAIPVGFAMGMVPFFRRMMEPVTEFFRFIPAIAMVVFALIWFGIGESSKIFLIVYNTFFSVALATEAGVTHVVPSRIHAVQSMGASQIQVVRFVVIPSVITYVIQGMRISMGRAFATIVSAEILAANSGLGFLIFSSREYSKMDTVIVAIIVLGILGLLIDRLFRRFTFWLGGEYLPKGI